MGESASDLLRNIIDFLLMPLSTARAESRTGSGLHVQLNGGSFRTSSMTVDRLPGRCVTMKPIMEGRLAGTTTAAESFFPAS